MRKITGKILNIAKNAKNTSDSEAGEDNKLDALDAFYHRMFERDIYLHISEISVMMVGVCLTGVSIMQVDGDIQDASTYIDDLLAIDSLIFLVAALIAYWAIRVATNSSRNVRRVGNIANTIFLIGMVLMVIVCLSIVIQADFSPPNAN
jgi:uncharacterized membrane protein